MSYRLPVGLFVVGTAVAEVAAAVRLANLLGVPTGQLPRNARGEPDRSSRPARTDLHELNERILRRLGGSSLGSPAIAAKGGSGDPSLESLRRRARAAFLIRHQTLEWVWGDPLTSLALPFWIDALDVRPVVVFVHGEPLATSPDGSTRWSQALAVAVWERYARTAMDNARGLPGFVLSTSALRAEPVKCANALSSFLEARGLSLDGPDAGSVTRLAESLPGAGAHGESATAAPLSTAQRRLRDIIDSMAGGHERVPDLPLPPETPATEPLLVEEREARGATRTRRRHREQPRRRRGGLAPGFGEPGALPDYLIIGAQKAGTSSLYRYIAAASQVVLPVRKELRFFDLEYHRGIEWYRSQFPALPALPGEGRRLTGEGTPEYLFHPLVPQRVKRLLPDVRLLVLLRDPIRRAVSNYHHEVRAGRETLPLDAALDAESDRLAGEAERVASEPGYVSYNRAHFAYQARGVYVDQLVAWRSQFPAEQMLVIKSERLFAQTEVEMRRVFAFLDLPYAPPPAPAGSVARGYLPPSAEAKARLEAFFAPHNARLYEFLGEDLGW